MALHLAQQVHVALCDDGDVLFGRHEAQGTKVIEAALVVD